MKSTIALLLTSAAVAMAAQPGFHPNEVVRQVRGAAREVSGVQRLTVDDGEFLVDTSGTHPESYPAAAFDGTNYLVVWEDQRGGSWFVYGTRVSQAGAILDSQGFLVSSPPYGGNPALAFDGTNFLVTWDVYYSSGVLDIYGARVNQAGDVLDPEGIAISTAGGGQSSPAVSFDGTNFLVVWTDSRSGSDNNIYGARVDQTGAVLDPAGLPISTSARGQYDPEVCFDGANWLVVWADYRFMSYDIYGARVAPGGAVLDPEGIAISIAGDYQQYPAATSGDQNCLVVWQDDRDGNDLDDIFGARVNQAGDVLDPEGIPISDGAIAFSGLDAVFEDNTWLVVWTDWRFGASDLYCARLSSNGTVLDSGPVVRQEGEQESPALARGNAGRTLLVYGGWAGNVEGKTYNNDRIWGKLNPSPGIADGHRPTVAVPSHATSIVRDVLYLRLAPDMKGEPSGALLDITGRQVLDLHPGANSIKCIAAGVYFMHAGIYAAIQRVAVLK